jgi:hypothetical protein
MYKLNLYTSDYLLLLLCHVSVTSLLPWGPALNPRQVYVRCVMDKVALGQVSEYFIITHAVPHC